MTALETDSVCSGYVPWTKGARAVALPPVSCPGEGSVAGWCSACRGCLAGMATPGLQREQRPWGAGTGTDPQPAQAETPRKLLLYLLGPGFSRETRLRASAATMGALQGRSRGGKQQGREWNRRFLGCWPKGKLHFRSNRRLMPLLVEGWVWSLSYLGKLKSKKKFQNHK